MTSATTGELDPRVWARLDDAIGTGQLDVPALGESVAQLLTEARKPDVDARRVADIIRRDAALAANLMKLANSAAYAGREPAVTLQQVVARMGTSMLCDLAVAIATKTRAFRVAGFEAEMRALFAHAFATALYAQQVARTRRLGVEEAFLAGLFHDVGRPLVLQLVVDLCDELAVAPDRAAMTWAADALHADVGARAIEVWQLGTPLADAVRYHHDFVGNPRRRAAALVAYASALASNALADAPAPDAEIAVRHHAGAVALELYPDDIAQLLAAAPRIVEQVGALA
jgi:HD-like signal output (HDOD) protein